MQQKISVVINTYNAEGHLQEVLETVKDFDEIVVCDMESTDHTLDITREYGCRVVTFPRGRNVIVEPARNFAIHQAKYPWVLVVDADELVTPELRDYLYRRIAEPNPPQGLLIRRRNQFMGIPERHHIGDHQLRFFVKDGTVWPPYVHTFPQVQGRVEKIPKLKNVMLVHLAKNTIHEAAERANRYTDLEVEKHKDKNYGVLALITRPFWRFFSAYFIKGKCLEGVPGLINSIYLGYYKFLFIAKMIERRKQNGICVTE